MSNIIFTISPTVNFPIMYIFIGVAAIVFIAGVSKYRKSQMERKKFASVIIIFAIIAAGLSVGGYFIQKSATTPATVEIGNKFIQINTGFTGTMNFNSSQIKNAYVDQIGTGSLSLSTRLDGLSNSVDNIGVFRLENGATAYVVSSSSTDLIILLTSGKYLIVGNENTTQIAAVFSQDVFPVSNSS